MGKELELAIKIGGKIDGSLGAAINNAQSQLGGLNSFSGKIAAGIAGVFAAVKIKDFVADSVQTYREYQSSINNTAAIAGVAAGTEEYQKLDKAARDAGKATVKTAKEAADALGYMALAGWSVDDSATALMPVLKLSAATETDLATTSDLVTDSMANLGLGINDLNHYLDVSVAANNKSNQTAMQLQEAYLGVGGVLKNLHAPIEDGAAVLGVLANRGTKGSEAGTALNAILVNMQKKSGDSAAAMAKLGVSMYDSNGAARSIVDVFQDISDKTAGMTDEQRNLTYQMIGGKSHVDSMAKIMAGFTDTAADGKREIYSLRDAFQNCDGALDDFYDIRTDTLDAAILVAQSALDDFRISLVERFSPQATSAIKSFADYMPEMTEKVSNGIQKVIDVSSKGAGFIKSHWSGIKTILTGIGSAYAAVALTGKAVSAANAVSTSYKILTGAMKKVPKGATGIVAASGSMRAALTALVSPAGLAVAAIAAVAAGVMIYKKVQKERIANNLNEHFGNISLSAKECSQVVESLFSNSTLSRADKISQQFEKVGDSLSAMNTATEALEKYNWKVGIGLKLSDKEMGDYRTQVDTFIQSAISAVEQQRYSLNLSLELLAGTPSLQAEMGTIINSIYEGSTAELTALGTEMANYVMAALSDGLLTADEADTIAAMQQKIANLTQQLTNAKAEAKLEALKLDFDFSSLDAESFKNLQSQISEWISNKETSLKDAQIEQIAAVNLLTKIPQEALDNGFTGTLNDYKEKVKAEIERAFQTERFTAHVKGIEISVDGITSAYKNEFDTAKPQIQGFYNDFVKDIDISGTDASGAIDPTAMLRIVQSQDFGLDKTSRKAISEMYAGMAEEVNNSYQLKSALEQAGAEIPQSLLEGLHNANVVGAASGDKVAGLRLLGDQLAQAGRTDILDKLKSLGGELSQTILEGATGVNGYNVKVDTKVEAGNTDTSEFENSVDEAVKNATEGADNTSEVSADADIKPGNVKTGGFFAFVGNALHNLFAGPTAYAAEVTEDVNVNTGTVDTSGIQSGVDAATSGAVTTAPPAQATQDVNINAGNINAESVKTSIFSKIKSIFTGTASQSVNVNMQATDGISGKAASVKNAISSIPAMHNTDISVSGNAQSKASSIKSEINSLPSSKTVTINIVTNGSVPKVAKGIKNAPGGVYMVNDQNVSDPREVIEYSGSRFYYEGRNVITALPKGANVYPASQSRKYINGSHKNGLTRVPYDGYIAELHAGEQVLTAGEASDYAENGMLSRVIESVREWLRGGSDNKNSGKNENSSQIVFSPNITVNGSGDRETIREAVKMTFADFKEFMEEYEQEKRRKAF